MSPFTNRELLERGEIRGGRYAALAASTLLVIASGAAIFIIRRVMEATDEFSAYRHPSEPWWVMLHVFVAPIFIGAVGSIFYHHMKRHWLSNLHRASGALLTALAVAMIYSGYALYFVAEEEARRLAGGIHTGSGALFALVMAWHIVAGRIAKRKARSA